MIIFMCERVDTVIIDFVYNKAIGENLCYCIGNNSCSRLLILVNVDCVSLGLPAVCSHFSEPLYTNFTVCLMHTALFGVSTYFGKYTIFKKYLLPSPSESNSSKGTIVSVINSSLHTCH